MPKCYVTNLGCYWRTRERNVGILTLLQLSAKGGFTQYPFFERFCPLFCPAYTQLNQLKKLKDFFLCFYDPKCFEI